MDFMGCTCIQPANLSINPVSSTSTNKDLQKGTMVQHPHIKAIVCDLGDVLFRWAPSTTTSISPKVLRDFMSTNTWFEYERGNIEQAECYRRLGQEYALQVNSIAEAFSEAAKSLTINDGLLTFLIETKKEYGGFLGVYAMSNVSKEDFPIMSSKMIGWELFDREFTSGRAGARKPELGFYHQVLRETNTLAAEVIFIDDNITNVLAAQSLGIHGVLFHDNMTVISKVQSLLSSPIEDAYRFLYQTGKDFDSVTTVGVDLRDNFARLLILEATGRRDLVNLEWEPHVRKRWCFFDGGVHPLAQRGALPNDLDTTCLALINLTPSPVVVSSLLDEMKLWQRHDGFFSAYYDRTRPRYDEVMSANVLTCFYHFGRGHEIENTLDLVCRCLRDETYSEGTYYYTSPDICLYFFARLLHSSQDAHLHARLESLVRTRIEGRIGKGGDAADLATRIYAAKLLRIPCGDDISALLRSQQEDGGWEATWIYRYGTTGIKIGNRGVTTAIAIQALSS